MTTSPTLSLMQAGQFARTQAAERFERDRAEAAEMDAIFDQKREAERLRFQAMFEQAVVTERLPLPEALTEADELIDAGFRSDVTDRDIIDVICATFDMVPPEAVERLAAIDFPAARVACEVAA